MKKYSLLGIIGTILVFILYFFDFFKTGLDRPLGILLIINFFLIFFRNRKIVLISTLCVLWLLIIVYFVSIWQPSLIKNYINWLFF